MTSQLTGTLLIGVLLAVASGMCFASVMDVDSNCQIVHCETDVVSTLAPDTGRNFAFALAHGTGFNPDVALTLARTSALTELFNPRAETNSKGEVVVEPPSAPAGDVMLVNILQKHPSASEVISEMLVDFGYGQSRGPGSNDSNSLTQDQLSGSSGFPLRSFLSDGVPAPSLLDPQVTFDFAGDPPQNGISLEQDPTPEPKGLTFLTIGLFAALALRRRALRRNAF